MKKVRQAEVAELAGVSRATVSRVINKSGYVADDVRLRVEKAIAETGYVPVAHTSIPTKPIIGIIAPHGVLNPYFEKLALCLEQECNRKGYSAIFCNSYTVNNQTLTENAELLTSIGVCGIIIESFSDEHLKPSTRNSLTATGLPVVFIERTGDCYGFNRVLVDNFLGTYSATTYLLQQGHTHLLYITKVKKSEVERSRKNGFEKALEEANNNKISYHIGYCEDFSPESAFNATVEAFSQDPLITGIVAWNDTYAAGALLFAYSRKKNVPEDITIIGHDDVLAPNLVPPLSSVHMPIEEIASSAIEIVSNYCNSDEKPTIRTLSLEPKLIIR